jgi:DNA invertase Pin-like site-specific DNA recombinase
MEVILYARSAVEDPRGRHCPKQLQECRDYAQSKNWSVSAEYFDPGVGGTPRYQRPALATAIAALRAGSVLLVIGVNRLSRDSRELDSLLLQVKALGARVIGIEDAFQSNHTWPFLEMTTSLDGVAKNWSPNQTRT